MSVKNYIIDEENTGKRLDLFISENEVDMSRSFVQGIIEKQQVKVNNQIKKSNYKLKLNDEVQVEIAEPVELQVEATNSIIRLTTIVTVAILRFFSKRIIPAMNPAKKRLGITPFQNLFIFWGLSDIFFATKSTTTYFAISDGWKDNGPRLIQRCAPFIGLNKKTKQRAINVKIIKIPVYFLYLW